MVIKSLQAGRGAAALAVAVYHTYLILYQKTHVSTFGDVAQFGYLGVPFFFVLSGFIIALAHNGDINNPEVFRDYVIKRVVRVYPLYWFFSIFYIAAAVAGIGDPDFSWSPAHLIEDITLIHFTPDFGSPPLKVAWTLFFEIQFYAFFAIAILSRRWAVIAGVTWFLGLLFIPATNRWLENFFSYWNLAFICGIIAYALFRRLPGRWWLLFTAAGLVCLVICFSYFSPLEMRDRRNLGIIPVSIGFGVLMLGLALFEKERQINYGRLVMLLGDGSYAIYLIHSAVISVLVALYVKLHLASLIPLSIAFFVILAIAAIAGLSAHLLLEKPFLTWVRKRRRNEKSAASMLSSEAQT
jgi:exopolysaccharide production protein ExoZ